MDAIKAGETVVIRLHDDRSTCMVKASGEQKIGRSRVSVKSLIGAPYGSIFHILDRKLQYSADECDTFDESNSRGEDGVFFGDQYGDNRSFIDSNTAQKLKDDDIKKLKESGTTGSDIIKKLIENSDTWNSKTVFAQEKWRRKKEKKYNRKIRVVKSTPSSLCEVYHAKGKDKICGIRSDTLAQILSQAAICAGSNCLIFESVLGLIVGSAAYRMHGHGQILAAYSGQQPHFPLVVSLNLDAESAKVIRPVSARELGPAAKDIQVLGFLSRSNPQELETENELRKVVLSEPRRPRVEEATSKPQNSSGRQIEDLLKVRSLLREGVSSLIIASRFHPLPILKEALTLLEPSGPFVIYCEYLAPLVECYIYLQKNNRALRLLLSDTWMREFQVLPGRVHPEMYMSTSGGYLLTGIHVNASATVEIAVDIEDIEREMLPPLKG